jgi:hypothetical protein
MSAASTADGEAGLLAAPPILAGAGMARLTGFTQNDPGTPQGEDDQVDTTAPAVQAQRVACDPGNVRARGTARLLRHRRPTPQCAGR